MKEQDRAIDYDPRLIVGGANLNGTKEFLALNLAQIIIRNKIEAFQSLRLSCAVAQYIGCLNRDIQNSSFAAKNFLQEITSHCDIEIPISPLLGRKQINCRCIIENIDQQKSIVLSTGIIITDAQRIANYDFQLNN